MLDSLILSSARKTRNLTPAMFVTACSFHGLVLTAVVAAPLAVPPTLPMTASEAVATLTLPVIPPPPRPPVASPAKTPAKANPPAPPLNGFFAPRIIPDEISRGAGPRPSIGDFTTGQANPGFIPGSEILITGGHSGGVPVAVVAEMLPPPPVPEPPKPVETRRIVVSSGAMAALLLKKVEPAYPPLAKAAKIQGVVILSVVVDASGRVQDVRVVSGHPLLTQAAVDAVSQWIYRPSMLSGKPVETSGTVVVKFSLT